MILRLYRKMGGEIITIGSDAHTTQYVGCEAARTQELLKNCGFRYFTTFTKGEPEFRSL
jgi:histidinol-phosphatase (PHP family)